MDQQEEQQDHISTFVHNRRVAVRTANFAQQLMLDWLLGRIIPLKVVVSVGEIDVLCNQFAYMARVGDYERTSL